MLHRIVEECGLVHNVVVSSALLNMYGKFGEIIKARAIFDDLRTSRSGHLDAGAWNSMLNVYSVHGDCESAQELFDQMTLVSDATAIPGGHHRCAPNAITFVNLLNAFSHGGQPEPAVRVLEDMRVQYAVEPTVQHYNCVVDALARSGHLEEAENFIRRMMKEGPPPNMITLVALLGACRWFGDKERFLANLHYAKALASQPEQLAALAVLEANVLAEAGDVEAQSEVLLAMKEQGLKKEAGKTCVEVDGKNALLHRAL